MVMTKYGGEREEEGEGGKREYREWLSKVGSRVPTRLHQHIAESLPALGRRRGVCAGEMRLVHSLGRLRGRARATHGGLVVGKDIFEPHIRLGHLEVCVLRIEDLDELGRCVTHDEDNGSNECELRRRAVVII